MQLARPPCDAGVILGAKTATPCAKHVETSVLVATILGSSMALIPGAPSRAPAPQPIG